MLPITLELIPLSLGLSLLLLVPVLMNDWRGSTVPSVAAVIVIVGVVQCVLYWRVQQRQRLIRQQTIAQMREMLQDIVPNQLSVISLNVQMARLPEPRRARIDESIREILDTLDDLSDDSLTRWESRYTGSEAAKPPASLGQHCPE